MILPKIYAQEVQRELIDLSLSENPLGCSPLVVKIMKNINIKDVNRYPDTSRLVQKIAEKFGIKQSQILLGCGSEQLIKLIAQTFLQQNETAMIQRGSFGVFTKECLLAQAKIKFFQPAKTTKIARVKLIFICNPNNPTGELLDPAVIDNIVRQAKNSIVVIDEAIGEFIKDTFILKAVKTKNCLVLRTFSKAFGLAGLRVGFAVGSERTIRKLTDFQQPFPVSSPSCKLALSALEDTAFVDKTIKFIAKERNFLISELKKRGFGVSNSVTNNIFIESPRAAILVEQLNRLGVSVISSSNFPGIKNSGFRISIKDRKTNRLFLDKLDEAIACRKSKKLIRSNNL